MPSRKTQTEALTLDDIRAHRAEIYRLANRYGIHTLWVIGSFYRGTQHDASDVDLVAEDHRGVLQDDEAAERYHNLRQLAGELAQLLGRPVEVMAAREPYCYPWAERREDWPDDWFQQQWKHAAQL